MLTDPGFRRGLLICTLSMMLGGCGSLISGAVDNVSTNLTVAMMDQDDPETVRQAAPAYLLLMDSFVQGEPDNVVFLNSAASLYAAYGGVFTSDEQRASRLTARAWTYSKRAACIEYVDACDIESMSFENWQTFVDQTSDDEAAALFTLATSWLAYLQAHAGDWAVLAQAPKAEGLLNRLGELEESNDHATILQYLGILNSIRPAALGGNPDKGKLYFDQALTLTNGQDLGAKVSYAKFYARGLYDRELHDRLLQEVVQADVTAGTSVLLNVMAQDEAQRLLDSADDYF